ncbi:MAG: hypothetical protein KME17_07455 [Cyanosarcina radialis HA8281-LM2]|nr:hypothetical protein [Cyanosarcina radialis HA8281-LM2]
MKLEVNSSNDRAKVIEPIFDSQDIYLDKAVLNYLEEQGKLISLDRMKFGIVLDKRWWEISDEIPTTRTSGAIASVIFSVGGSCRSNESGTAIICTLA